MLYRVCRDCGAEYRPDVLRCSDCGGEDLEAREEDESGLDAATLAVSAASGQADAAAPSGQTDPADYGAIFSAATAAEVEPLAERLGAAKIPFAVRGSFQAFQLLVRKEDVGRAMETVATLLGEAPTEAAEDKCPACGTDVVTGAAECPECGLAVGSPPEA